MSLETYKTFTLSQAVLAKRAARVLLAEDDADLRRLIAAGLRSDNYFVSECADGACVLERFGVSQEQPARPPPDVLVCDVRMPGLSGLDVLATLRAWRSTTPVILISAYQDDQTRRGAVQLGAAALLAKPLDMDGLRNMLLRLCTTR